jgi:cellulose biosynthesis protein BcsQ
MSASQPLAARPAPTTPGVGWLVAAVTQWKGGVGKSTLAVHISALIEHAATNPGSPFLAQLTELDDWTPARVDALIDACVGGGVLVDAEPWGAATSWWAGSRAADVWHAPGGPPLLNALRRGTIPRPRTGQASRARLVPSHKDLLLLTEQRNNEAITWSWSDAGTVTQHVVTPAGPTPLAHALRDALRVWASVWAAHVLVDTPAGFGPLADGPIAAADVLVIPVTLDQWSVPPLRRFMAAYAGRIRAGLVVPNRITATVDEADYLQALTAPGVITPPFQLGPMVDESKLLHGTARPLVSGQTTMSDERLLAIGQLAAVTERLLALGWAARLEHANREVRA